MASEVLYETSRTSIEERDVMNGSSTVNAIADSIVDLAVVEYWIQALKPELDALHDEILDGRDIKTTSNAHKFSVKIMHAPRRRCSQPLLAAELATRLYPDSANAVSAYESDIKALRSAVTRQHWASARQKQERQTLQSRVLEQGQWDRKSDPIPLSGPISLPMPVEQASKDSLEPYFHHLQSNGTIALLSDETQASLGTEPGSGMKLIEYPKGVLYADGRLDLCKMVVGPRSIRELMDSLDNNTFVKHFLLGNNIIGAVGAKAIASFIDDHPDGIQTWYLAGNCINSSSLTLLVDSMITSNSITNVWLKRNPLGQSAGNDIARLVMQSKITTLDLDQTELGDAGVAQIFSTLTKHNKLVGLRHIYLNACGISALACEQISAYLTTSNCNLESLYMSCNPIGSEVALLAPGIAANRSLRRLVLRSCGLEPQATIKLLNAVVKHASLLVLDLGQAYATEDLQQRYNWLTDDCCEALAKVIASTRLQYLALDDVPMTSQALNDILATVAGSCSIEFFSATSLFNGLREKDGQKIRKAYLHLSLHVQEKLQRNVERVYGCSYTNFLARHKRSLTSPPGIELIDSVYRNRDAALARRGLQKLDKWWKPEDQTVIRSQEGLLE